MKQSEYGAAYENGGFAKTQRLLISMGVSPHDADEISQAAWARGWEYIDQLRDSSLVCFWVNSIALNLSRARFRPLRGINFIGLSLTENRVGYDQKIDVQVTVNQLTAFMSPEDMEIVCKSLEGYSAEELGKEEGITAGGMRVKLFRVRQWLRERLANTSGSDIDEVVLEAKAQYLQRMAFRSQILANKQGAVESLTFVQGSRCRSPGD